MRITNPKTLNFPRDLYAEKAMPFLRLESSTPTETEKTISELKNQIEKKAKNSKR